MLRGVVSAVEVNRLRFRVPGVHFKWGSPGLGARVRYTKP